MMPTSAGLSVCFFASIDCHELGLEIATQVLHVVYPIPSAPPTNTSKSKPLQPPTAFAPSLPPVRQGSLKKRPPRRRVTVHVASSLRASLFRQDQCRGVRTLAAHPTTSPSGCLSVASPPTARLAHVRKRTATRTFTRVQNRPATVPLWCALPRFSSVVARGQALSWLRAPGVMAATSSPWHRP